MPVSGLFCLSEGRSRPDIHPIATNPHVPNVPKHLTNQPEESDMRFTRECSSADPRRWGGTPAVLLFGAWLALAAEAGWRDVQASLAGGDADGSAVDIARAEGRAICGLYGDVNDDGQVNSSDALIILTWTVGLPVPDPARVQVAGDVNADLLVNSVDALVALRFTVGLGTQGTRINQPICTAAANVVVDPSRTFQTINGWEAALASGWSWTPSLRDAIADAAVNDLGINRVRVQATAGNTGGTMALESADGMVAQNDNGDPNVVNPAGFKWAELDGKVAEWVLPLRQRVQARGEPFVVNIVVISYHAATSFLTAPAEYAEYVQVVLEHLRSTFNLEPDLWEVINEPDGGSAQRNGTQLGNMLKAAGDRVRQRGFQKVMFVVPTTTTVNNFPARWDGILAVAGTAQYIAEASYHRYGATPTIADLNTIRDRAAARGARTGMLERIGADYKDLYEDLTEANVSAWRQLTLAFPGDDDGGHFYKVSGNTFTLSNQGWYLRQYFRYIRPGAVRLGASSTDTRIKPVAFRNRNGNIVVVAYTTQQATLTVAGLPAGTYQVSFTTASQRGATAAPVAVGAGGTLSTSIPAAGVITISR